MLFFFAVKCHASIYQPEKPNFTSMSTGVISSLIQYLRKHGNTYFPQPLNVFFGITGVTEDGIFRRSGVSSEVQKLKKQCEQKQPIDFASANIFSLGALLKALLRDLPEPVLTYTHYSQFVSLIHVEESDQLMALKKLLQQLPKANQLLLQEIIELLCDVLSHSGKNQMVSNVFFFQFFKVVVRTLSR